MKIVNLAQTGTGHAGTVGDPYSWADAVAACDGNTETNFSVYGQMTMAAADIWPNGNYAFNLSPYTANPWRININLHSGANHQITGTWTGGIFQDQIGDYILRYRAPYEIRSCWIRSGNQLFRDVGLVSGSTIIDIGTNYGGVGFTIEDEHMVFIDSILISENGNWYSYSPF